MRIRVQDVVRLEQRRGLRMARLPAVEAGERVLFVLGPGDRDEGLGRLPVAAPLLLGVRALPA
jgi:hypothetical protein